MTITSPIDELFGQELEYIRRGISQLDLILACKERRILELDEQLAASNLENLNLKNQISKLRDTVTQLQIKLEDSPIVTINNLETQEAIEKFFNSF